MDKKEIETRKSEIETRLAEISKELEKESEAKTEEEISSEEVKVEKLSAEVETLTEERKGLIAEETKVKEAAEQRQKLLNEIANGEKGKEEEKMEKELEKFDLSSEEYRTGWAKKLMGRNDLTEKEKRALGDAVTTTSTTFVEATAEANGVNNGGLLIPTTVRTDILTLIEKQSPFYRDIRKLAVAGNVDMPYMDSSDDAEWVVETADSKNEGIEFKDISLTGHELAKNVVVKWKLEKMAVADFISFITAEIANKMAKAFCHAVIYGTGSNQPTGAIYGLSATEGTDPLNTIIETLKTLSDDFKIGAKAYVSSNVNIDMIGYQDENKNYPFIQGIANNKLISIEVEPFLENGDIIVGNPANYVFNTVEPLSVARESKVVGRTTTYASYGIFDGKPRTGAFKKGSYVVTSL